MKESEGRRGRRSRPCSRCAFGLFLFLLPQFFHFSPLQYPYRVLPNRTGSDGIIGGIIECVPNASTRDEIGKATACSLKDYYISRFGPPESASFQRAQKAFIVSAAGYAVCSWILQVKDRHNGNLMIDGEGHMIHIGQRKTRIKTADKGGGSASEGCACCESIFLTVILL